MRQGSGGSSREGGKRSRGRQPAKEPRETLRNESKRLICSSKAMERLNSKKGEKRGKLRCVKIRLSAITADREVQEQETSRNAATTRDPSAYRGGGEGIEIRI